MGDLCIVGSQGFEYPGTFKTYWAKGWGEALVGLARRAGAEPSLQIAVFADGDELETSDGEFPKAGIEPGESSRKALERFLRAQRKRGAPVALEQLGYDLDEIDLDEAELSVTARVECTLTTSHFNALATAVADDLPAELTPTLPRWRGTPGDRLVRAFEHLASAKRWPSHLALAVLVHVARGRLRVLHLEEDEPSWEEEL